MALEVEVPKAVVDAIAGEVCLNRLQSKCALKEIGKTYNEIKGVLKTAPNMLEIVNKAIQAATVGDKNSLQDNIRSVLINSLWEKWILIFVASNSLVIPQTNDTLPVCIPCTFSPEENKGCVWIDFPGRSPFSFGRGLQTNPLLREKCDPFIKMIAHQDTTAIMTTFMSLRSLVEKMLATAKDVVSPIREIVDENSLWEIEMYIANLSTTAFLVNTKAKLSVQDENKAEYSEPCHLVLLEKDESGKIHHIKTRTPLVVRGTSGVEVAFFTSIVQKEMKRGKALRDAFVTGKANCSINFNLETAGIFRSKKVRTRPTPFRSTE
ncbi:hypothetical protein EHM69_12110 [candidate division KSB1 bacterium]|nr:MAG: hypothetical protein EHM69_12110 [candidate division KSB1 bacterium]